MTKPLKRVPALQSFSREHHQGLLLVWKIKQGLKNNIELARISNYVHAVYSIQLVPHFEDEEMYVFPILGNDHDLIVDVLKQHRNLHDLLALPPYSKSDLISIQEKLKAHIRFEEREVFEAIQKVATPLQLQLIIDMHSEQNVDFPWEDLFWK